MKDGGPAFPKPAHETSIEVPSMSLRHYFAAKAMQAIIAKLPLFSAGVCPAALVVGELDATVFKAEIMTAVVCGAYQYADAMLLMAEAEKQPDHPF